MAGMTQGLAEGLTEEVPAKKAAKGKGRSRKLLNVLFVLIVVPVVLLLARSLSIAATQQRVVLEISGRYVRQLARYGAERFDRRSFAEGRGERVRDFLTLRGDRGYERALRRGERDSGKKDSGEKDSGKKDSEERERENRSDGKFIPGMLAYVREDGTFIAGSDGAEILPELWRHGELRTLIVDSMTLGNGREVAYSLCAWPTEDPGVAAVAAVTMFTWTGGNGFIIRRFVNETMWVAFFCLGVLFLLRRTLIRPLRVLSSGLRTFRWGQEVPEIDAKTVGGTFFGLEVGEIASLREAIAELAVKAAEKTELEKRYVGDIVKAQEEERNRLAREIHDGPIQVVAALIQRVQMASLALDAGAGSGVNGAGADESAEAGRAEARAQLAVAEETARSAVEDLREVCDSLVPPWVSLGLARCMEEAGARLARQHGVTVEVDVDLEGELPQEKTLALFRIFQEGVSNAVRHGRAGVIKLSVTQDADAVAFVLRDNGSGFEPGTPDAEALFASGRRGLAGMRRRVDSLGGALAIISSPGAGTSVEVRFAVSGVNGAAMAAE
ncbi:MAG: sensor histidine kinase [Synergistaceae bacterium]|jgi:signal transduction histidine kinase|nr:sensor histidine kinase [Synergistaceae bacterium]